MSLSDLPPPRSSAVASLSSITGIPELGRAGAGGQALRGTASCGFCAEAGVPSSLRLVTEVEMPGDGCLGGKSALPVHLLGSFRRNLRIA